MGAVPLSRGSAASPEPSRARERFYLPQLDVLRFFAFFGVFVSHAYPIHYRLPEPQTLLHLRKNGAGFGVDLFFALSSYLITSLLLRERAATGRVDVRSFYIRRILRIWPLYFFFLSLALAAYLWFSSAVALPALGVDFLALFLLVGNFVYAVRGTPSLFLGPLWSVCVEEQFYLCWPPVIRRASKRGLVLSALAMVAVSAAVRMASSAGGYGGDFIWCNTFARLDPIAAGILLAVLPYERMTGIRAGWRLALIGAGALLWGMVAEYGGDLHIPTTTMLVTALCYPAAALGSAAFLVAALGSSVNQRSAIGRSLIYLGRISYGLYIYHTFALLIVQAAILPRLLAILMVRRWPLWLAWIPYLGTSLALTVAISAASYRWLESPFLRLKRRFTHVPSRPV